jgi:hypothetical protein
MKTLAFKGAIVLLAALVVVQRPTAQTFTSGSDGSDGALTLATGAGTVIFDPFDTARWGKVLDADGDGVYNFTTISIAQNTTLVLRGDKVNRPLYWLASGGVVVSGTINLSGSAGAANQANELEVRRVLAIPGPGGYAGGSGGRQTPPLPATPGEGPGGGSGGVAVGNNGCTTNGNASCGKGGVYGGNRFLMPLIGGSGGEGGTVATAIGSNGGAGGGAILIASSTSVTVDGEIRAMGGGGADQAGIGRTSGAGSGGAIRIVAPVISGAGTFFVGGGSPAQPIGGGSGWVRLEGNQISSSLNFNPSANTTTRGAPGVPATLRPATSLRVSRIDGNVIPPNPTGMFSLPDVVISKTGPVDVVIEAKGIPPGTVVTLQIYPETPVDANTTNLTVPGTLTGTLQSSTVTVPFTFPFGFSRGWVRASWTQ